MRGSSRIPEFYRHTVAQRRELAARAAHDATTGSARTGWLIEHVQTQRLRREGRLTEAQAALRLLHLQAERRPPADAYLSAGSLGVVLSMQGDNDGALDLFYQALAIARRSGSWPVASA